MIRKKKLLFFFSHTFTKMTNQTGPKRNPLDQYYEYRVYDKNLGGRREMYSGFSEYAPCPVVVMSRHQGFQWNDELFVNEFRRSAGYECHKSASLENRDKKIGFNTNQRRTADNSPEVIEINLTEADCDVWP